MKSKSSEKVNGIELVAIARIVKPKGLKGEVVADLLTDFPDRFENLEEVIGIGPERRELSIQRYSFHKRRVVLKFEGVNTIEEAELLRNYEVCVLESDVVELEEGEYFDWELEGCRVLTAEKVEIGFVKELFRAGENLNLVVTGNEKDHMIPFVEAICTDVDIGAKVITVDLPEGLLEF